MAEFFIGVREGEPFSEIPFSNADESCGENLVEDLSLSASGYLEVKGKRLTNCSVSFVSHSASRGHDYFVVQTPLNPVLSSILTKYHRGFIIRAEIVGPRLSLKVRFNVQDIKSLKDAFSAIAMLCSFKDGTAASSKANPECFELDAWSMIRHEIGTIFCNYLQYYMECSLPYLNVARAGEKKKYVMRISKKFFCSADGAAMLQDELSTGVLTAISRRADDLLNYSQGKYHRAFLEGFLAAASEVSKEEKTQILSDESVYQRSLQNFCASQYDSVMSWDAPLLKKVLLGLKSKSSVQMAYAIRILAMAYMMDPKSLPAEWIGFLEKECKFSDVCNEVSTERSYLATGTSIVAAFSVLKQIRHAMKGKVVKSDFGENFKEFPSFLAANKSTVFSCFKKRRRKESLSSFVLDVFPGLWRHFVTGNTYLQEMC